MQQQKTGQNTDTNYSNIGSWTDTSMGLLHYWERMAAAVKEYAKGFYTSEAWKTTRRAYFKQANGLCERCKAAGKFAPGKIVHHKRYITPKNINDPRITLSFDNLELLCEDCHNKEHNRKENSRYTFAADGSLLLPEKQRPPGRGFPGPE